MNKYVTVFLTSAAIASTLFIAGCNKSNIEKIGEISDAILNEHNESNSENNSNNNNSNKNYISARSASDNEQALSFSNASDVSASDYNGVAYAYINNNEPEFNDSDKNTNEFQTYGDLDELGRCTYAYANVCQNLLPTEKRGNISHVKPTGWHSVKYDCISTKNLYNRCHLIAYSLTGQNANEKNLVTGTSYMNTSGMGDFETQVLYAVRYDNLHVLYRVTPYFKGNNLVCEGVQMEAYSVEDNGNTVKFNVFVYNVEPGIAIDYTTGDSHEV